MKYCLAKFSSLEVSDKGIQYQNLMGEIIKRDVFSVLFLLGLSNVIEVDTVKVEVFLVPTEHGLP